MRVMLASEYPEVANLLRGAVENEAGAVVVGQAKSATRALTLARKLRPDLVIIDCHLPHIMGMDNAPLSRASGLDAAQTIASDVPNARVMVLNNLDTLDLPPAGWTPDTLVSFGSESAASLPLTLRDIIAAPRNGPVFARVHVEEHELKQKALNITDQVVLFGGLAILVGLIMMLTLILLVPGAILAAAGVVTVLAGLGGKAVFGSQRRREGR